MQPSALEKAESMARYVKERGAPLGEFQLALSLQEALDLVEWYADQHGGTNDCFDADVEIVRITKDPWPLLAHFNLCGLVIAPATLGLN